MAASTECAGGMTHNPPCILIEDDMAVGAPSSGLVSQVAVRSGDGQ